MVEKKPPSRDEAFEQIEEQLRAREKKFADRQPSEEAYAESSLPGWLELNRWSKEEGICLLFDIEPATADIDWYGFLDDDWKRIDLLRIRNAAFLREHEGFLDIPRLAEMAKPGTSAIRDYGDDLTVGYKEYLIRNTEPAMHRAWQLLNRNEDRIGNPPFRHSPSGFIKFAAKYEIEVPWLNWAIENQLLESPVEEVDGSTSMRQVNSTEDELLPSLTKKLTSRAENNYLKIIGGLLRLMLSEDSYGKKRSLYGNQSAVISAILEKFPNEPGLSERNLQDKFAAAKRILPKD